MEESLNSILKVLVNDEWTDIPALRGYSMRMIGEPSDISHSTTHRGETVTQTGHLIKVFDEKKSKLDPNYEYDEFITWDGFDGFDGKDGKDGKDGVDGANGSGNVNSVDGIEAPPGSSDVPLYAVSYGRVQALDSAAQAVARSNINAQVKGDYQPRGDYQPKGNYIYSPLLKNVNEFLKYDGNDQWSTSTVSVLPESTDTGVLMKSGSSMSTLSWMAPISNLEIDEILSN